MSFVSRREAQNVIMDAMMELESGGIGRGNTVARIAKESGVSPWRVRSELQTLVIMGLVEIGGRVYGMHKPAATYRMARTKSKLRPAAALRVRLRV